MSRPLRVACVLIASLAIATAAPSLAAEPSSGKVSRSQPKTTWTGAITSFQSWQLYNQGQNQCLPLSCDTFTLEVADGPAPLTITVESADSGIFVEVVKPDGESETFGGTALKVKAVIKNAANGSYTINVAQNEQTQATHEGTAELSFPAPPAAAAPPAATPAPAATTVSVKARGASARRVRRSGLPVTVSSSAPLSNVSVRLLRGRRAVATASVARVEGTARLRLRFRRKPSRGTYTLRLTGTDAGGAPVSASSRVRLRR